MTAADTRQSQPSGAKHGLDDLPRATEPALREMIGRRLVVDLGERARRAPSPLSSLRLPRAPRCGPARCPGERGKYASAQTTTATAKITVPARFRNTRTRSSSFIATVCTFGIRNSGSARMKVGFSPRRNGMPQQQRRTYAADDADHVQPEQHEPLQIQEADRARRHERRDQQRVDRQARGARHERRREDRRDSVASIRDHARRHDRRHRAREARQQRDHGLTRQPDASASRDRRGTPRARGSPCPPSG